MWKTNRNKYEILYEHESACFKSYTRHRYFILKISGRETIIKFFCYHVAI